MPRESGSDDSVETFSQLQQILINVGGGVKNDKEKNVLGFFHVGQLMKVK